MIKLKSPRDELTIWQVKLMEYIQNGAQLDWLIDPENRQLFCYRPQQSATLLNNLRNLSGENIVSGFRLDLQII